MIRALQLLSGLLLVIAGGWFIWLRKDSPGGIFNVVETETLWLVATGLVLTLLGLVLFLMGLSPRAKVEQIHWRYPEPSPKLDLAAGPRFTSDNSDIPAQAPSRPSWLQEASDALEKQTSPTQVEEASPTQAFEKPFVEKRAIPRNELPFERPRFGVAAEDTSNVSLVKEPMSFTNKPESESTPSQDSAFSPFEAPKAASASSETTDDVSSFSEHDEETALREFEAEMDDRLNDQDIDGLALEAANASMDWDDSDDQEETLELTEELPEELEETDYPSSALHADENEDDAFEKQLEALASAATKVTSTASPSPMFTDNIEQLRPAKISLLDAEEDANTVDELPDFIVESHKTDGPVFSSKDLELDSVEELDALDLDEPEYIEIIEESDLDTDLDVSDPVLSKDSSPEYAVIAETVDSSAKEILISKENIQNASDSHASDIEEFNDEIAALGLTADLAALQSDEFDELESETIATPEDILDLELEDPSEEETLSDETIDFETATQVENADDLDIDLSGLEIPDYDELELETESVEDPTIDATASKAIEQTDELADTQLDEEDNLDIEALPTLDDISDIGVEETDETPILEDDLPLAALDDLDLALPEIDLDLPDPDLVAELDAANTLNAKAEIEDEADEIEALPLEEPEILEDIIEEILPSIEELEELPSPETNLVSSEKQPEKQESVAHEQASASKQNPQATQGKNTPYKSQYSGMDELKKMFTEANAPPASGLSIEQLTRSAMDGPPEGDTAPLPKPPPPFVEKERPKVGSVTHPRLQPVKDALDANDLETADSLLANMRRSLVNEGDQNTPELAELTALAGDHAAASGRPGGAKWLWRLALQRFGEADSIETPAAKAVSERLRQFEH